MFLIVLGENGYEETFGAELDRALPVEDAAGKGRAAAQLLRGDKGDLANQIALLSGQGPTPETAANCPNYTDIVPGTARATGRSKAAAASIRPRPRRCRASWSPQRN